MRMQRHQRYAETITDSIRKLQRRNLADPTLDPELAAAALGAVTYRFTELWLVQGAVDCTVDQATEHITKFLANALQMNSETSNSRGKT